MNDEFVEYR